jgi:hypothetical protein
VGFALWFYSFSTFRGRHGLYLEDLFVRPAQRGHGLGKALLAHLARRCVAENLARLEWSVLDWNTPSIDFYKAQGAEMLDGWTTCRVTACEPGREFGFAVLGPGDTAVNNWHYRFTPRGDGTDVTESFRMNSSLPARVFWMFAGYLRGRRNVRDMRTTLERIKKVVEED